MPGCEPPPVPITTLMEPGGTVSGSRFAAPLAGSWLGGGYSVGNAASVDSASSVQATQPPSGRRTAFQCGGMPAWAMEGTAPARSVVQP